ncbi:MAG: sigma factor [Bacillota bacterium]
MDEILVKRVLNGELAVYEELVQRYQDKIYGYAVRMLSPEDARDAAQEVFIRVFGPYPPADLDCECHRRKAGAETEH